MYRVADRRLGRREPVEGLKGAKACVTACSGNDVMAVRVLIVDSTPGVAEAIGATLQVEGYQVALAATGRGGIDIAGEHQPDVVLLRRTLPDMPALRFQRRLQARGMNPPIVLLGTDPAAAGAAKLPPADAYLAEPLVTTDLLATVARLTRRLRR